MTPECVILFAPTLPELAGKYNFLSGAAAMKRTFDFIGLNSVISESFKPLHHVTPSSARKAGMEAGIKGTTPANCHHSYFATKELDKEWYRGYRMGKQNQE